MSESPPKILIPSVKSTKASSTPSPTPFTPAHKLLADPPHPSRVITDENAPNEPISPALPTTPRRSYLTPAQSPLTERRNTDCLKTPNKSPFSSLLSRRPFNRPTENNATPTKSSNPRKNTDSSRQSLSSLEPFLHPYTDPNTIVGGIYKVRCSTYHPLLDMLYKTRTPNTVIAKRVSDQLRSMLAQDSGKFRPCVVTSIEIERDENENDGQGISSGSVSSSSPSQTSPKDIAPSDSATASLCTPPSTSTSVGTHRDVSPQTSTKTTLKTEKRITVYLFATFDKTKIEDLPELVLRFLVPVSPTRPPKGISLPTVETNPTWPDKPQWIIAVPLVLPEAKSIYDVWWRQDDFIKPQNPGPRFTIGGEQVEQLVKASDGAYTKWITLRDREKNRIIIDFLNHHRQSRPDPQVGTPTKGVKRQALTVITNRADEPDEEGWTVVTKKSKTIHV